MDVETSLSKPNSIKYLMINEDYIIVETSVNLSKTTIINLVKCPKHMLEMVSI